MLLVLTSRPRMVYRILPMFSGVTALSTNMWRFLMKNALRGVVLLLLTVAAVRFYPDLRRYLKIRAM